jgi:hypothetical protein
VNYLEPETGVLDELGGLVSEKSGCLFAYEQYFMIEIPLVYEFREIDHIMGIVQYAMVPSQLLTQFIFWYSVFIIHMYLPLPADWPVLW